LTLAQARAKLVAMKAEVLRDTKSAVSRTLTKAEAEAKRMSSGPLTLGELRKRDHPYALRHGPLGNVGQMPGKDRSIINEQSGEFKSKWAVDKPQSGDREANGRISNTSGVADFLTEGTNVMTRRPIDDHLKDFIETTGTKEMELAASRLERFYG